MVVDYKTTTDLVADLKAASPDGYDVLFDNVGNAMIDTVIPLLRPGGRIVISGQLADYNTATRQCARHHQHALLHRQPPAHGRSGRVRRPQGLPGRAGGAGRMIERGEVKVREHRYRGLEAAPQAFIDLFTDNAFGRRIIDIGAEPG